MAAADQSRVLEADMEDRLMPHRAETESRRAIPGSVDLLFEMVNRGRLAMPATIGLRQEFDAKALQGLARPAKDGPQAGRVAEVTARLDPMVATGLNEALTTIRGV